MTTSNPGLDPDSLDLILGSLRQVAREQLGDRVLLDLDARDEFPTHIVRDVFGAELGVQLLFVPEEYGGMGGSAFDIYRTSEVMAEIDLGIATGLLATFLGSEPVNVGGTPEQKAEWMGKIANEHILFAYGATEPGAGSDLGALQTVATRVEEGGTVTGYRLTGSKQWISNGGVAEACTILANTPGGPTWFIVDRGTPGFTAGKPEDKHGIRASNTAALSLDEVYVSKDRLIGGVEGQGLIQAQLVFGYTRLMVAAFGLGAGWAAIRRAADYSTRRIQAGGPLSEKQGYTLKLITPHAVRLEAARAYIEETAARIDAGEPNLNTEGAIAKYMATEAGNAAADAAIQALGGYGYTREYMVEKIKRDVRITTIYEGTSEIMEMTIARDRWQAHLKSRGEHYRAEAQRLSTTAASAPTSGADVAALAAGCLAELLERARFAKLTRHQHVLFRLGELIAWTECAGAFARRAARHTRGDLPAKADRRFAPDSLAAMSRAFARVAAKRVVDDGALLLIGGGGTTEADAETTWSALGGARVARSAVGWLADMELATRAVYSGVAG